MEPCASLYSSCDRLMELNQRGGTKQSIGANQAGGNARSDFLRLGLESFPVAQELVASSPSSPAALANSFPWWRRPVRPQGSNPSAAWLLLRLLALPRFRGLHRTHAGAAAGVVSAVHAEGGLAVEEGEVGSPSHGSRTVPRGIGYGHGRGGGAGAAGEGEEVRGLRRPEAEAGPRERHRAAGQGVPTAVDLLGLEEEHRKFGEEWSHRPDARHIFVDIGLGFLVEFTWQEALQFISVREAKLTRQIDEYTHLIASIKAQIKLVCEGIRELLVLPAE